MDKELVKEAMVKNRLVEIQLLSGEIFTGYLIYGFNFDFLQLDTGAGSLTIAKEAVKKITFSNH